MTARDAMQRGRRGVLAALPLAAVAVVALLAVVIRSEAGPAPVAAAVPVPDAVLVQQCVEGAAVGSGNEGLAGDCALLLAARDALRGTETLNWSATLAIASWEGITVSGSPRRVTQLDIDGWNSWPRQGRDILLAGTIPPELGGLPKLQRLILSRNALTGTIPAELGHLAELTSLQLYGNQLGGGIPPELGYLSNLGQLELHRNQLSGSIPVELGQLSNLYALQLQQNQLTGAVPAGLGDLARLSHLKLGANAGLTGCIPSPLRSVSLNDLSTLGLSYCTTTTTRTLTTSATGSGRISPLPGTHSYLDGDRVTVTARPAAGWSLLSWGGDCSTAGTAATCALTMSADRTASVTFERVPLTLTVTAGDGGTVTHDGGVTLYHGDEVTLTAAWSDATHDFGGWGGDCTHATGSVCVLTMNADKTASATFSALSATRCSNTNDANCIRAVYIGAPGDYAQVVDIPTAMRLNGGPGGTYFVDAGLEVTVVTAARLPGGWTRFYLEQSPLGDPPVSARQLVPPVGTTYTFTVSDDAVEATDITYELKQAKPFVRPRPDGKPQIGATVVETDFQVQDCSSGIAVTNPQANTELVGDCESLLGLRDTIRGTGRLNWTAGKAMSDWMGVTVSGTPQRVTGLDLSNLGLDGELSGLLGNLTGLTALDLGGNPLTGVLPSKLALLENLTTVSLSGTSFTGCAPAELGDVATNDVSRDDCGDPVDVESTSAPSPGEVIVPGTYQVDLAYPERTLVFDVPEGTPLHLMGVFLSDILPWRSDPSRSGLKGVVLTDPGGDHFLGIDIQFGGQWSRDELDTTPAEVDKAFELILESTWHKP